MDTENTEFKSTFDSLMQGATFHGEFALRDPFKTAPMGMGFITQGREHVLRDQVERGIFWRSDVNRRKLVMFRRVIITGGWHEYEEFEKPQGFGQL